MPNGKGQLLLLCHIPSNDDGVSSLPRLENLAQSAHKFLTGVHEVQCQRMRISRELLAQKVKKKQASTGQITFLE